MLEEPSESILKDINALQSYDKADLIKRYKALFGKEPRCLKIQMLRSEIAYKLQEDFYGGMDREHDDKLKKAADVLGEGEGLRRSRSKTILPGTRLVRNWHGKTYEVTVRPDGAFAYGGRLFKSLTGVATEITGTRWNGRTFFGITK